MTRDARAALAHPSDPMLWRLIAGDDLSREQQRGTERHLDACPDCIRRLQDLGTRGIAAEILAHGDTLGRPAPKVVREMGLTGRVTRVHLARALVGLSIPYVLQSPDVPCCLLDHGLSTVDEQRAFVLSLLQRSSIQSPLREKVAFVGQAVDCGIPGKPELSLRLARSALDISLALAPRDPYALLWRGWAAVAESCDREAEAWWTRIRKVTSDAGFLGSIDGNLGTLAYRKKELAKAKRLHVHALREGSSFEKLRARLNLAVILSQERARGEARQCLEEIDPSTPRATHYVRRAMEQFANELLPLVRPGSKWHELLGVSLEGCSEAGEG